jgi:glycosyltransferase involved in cell wall biosynthesis
MKTNVKKKITVFIPTFNEEARLPEIFKAYGKYAHFVIVDNHSTDNTLKVAEEYGAIFFTRIAPRPTVDVSDYKKAFDLAPTEWIFLGSCSELIAKDIFEEFYENVIDSNFKAMYVERHSYTYGKRTHKLLWSASDPFLHNAVRIFKKGYIDWENARIHNETPVLIDRKDLYMCNNKCFYNFRTGIPSRVEDKHAGYADLEAVHNFKIGKKFGFFKMVLSALWHSVNLFICNRSMAGFICALYQFQITTNIYIRLWLLDTYSNLENVDVETLELRQKLLDEFSNE